MRIVDYDDIISLNTKAYIEGAQDMSFSPYTPSAGVMPNFLAGRDNVIDSACNTVDALLHNAYAQPIVFYGLRGVGKTVLLNRIEEDLEDSNETLCQQIECKESKTFKRDMNDALESVSHSLSKVALFKDNAKRFLDALKSFRFTWSPADGEVSIGLDNSELEVIANSGTYSTDMITVFLELGRIAKKCDKVICFFIDELQYLEKDELDALIMAIHRVNQKRLPITIMGAGLPRILQLVGNAKSYGERLFNFIPIDSLKMEDTRKALVEPATSVDVSFDEDAIEYIYSITHGYPYYIQEYGAAVWNYIGESQTINIDMAKTAFNPFIEKLDNSFFKLRYDRATKAEREFLHAMASCSTLPCDIAEVASIIGREQTSISIHRSNLLHKGLIHSTGHGKLDFSVPLFSEYLHRISRK